MTKYRDLIRWPMSVPRELTPWPKKTFAVSYKSPQYYAVAACDSGGYLLGFKRRHKFGVMMTHLPPSERHEVWFLRTGNARISCSPYDMEIHFKDADKNFRFELAPEEMSISGKSISAESLSKFRLSWIEFPRFSFKILTHNVLLRCKFEEEEASMRMHTVSVTKLYPKGSITMAAQWTDAGTKYTGLVGCRMRLGEKSSLGLLAGIGDHPLITQIDAKIVKGPLKTCFMIEDFDVLWINSRTKIRINDKYALVLRTLDTEVLVGTKVSIGNGLTVCPKVWVDESSEFWWGVGFDIRQSLQSKE